MIAVTARRANLILVLCILVLAPIFVTSRSLAAESGRILSASPSTFTAGESKTVVVRVQNTGDSDDMIIEVGSINLGWIVSPEFRNPFIPSGEYFDAQFTVTAPISGGIGTIVWDFLDDDILSNDLVATFNQTVSAPPQFRPYFADARISGIIDNDRDGFASQFELEINVDSNIAGHFYVKVWKDGGIIQPDDYLGQSSTIAVDGPLQDYVALRISSAGFPDQLQRGSVQFRLDLYDAGKNEIVQSWRPVNDLDLGNIKVEAVNEDFLPNPYGVATLEPVGVGLFSTIRNENRNNLTDLASLKANGLTFGDRPLNTTDQMLTIVFHGWNPGNSPDARLVEILSALEQEQNANRLDRRWRIIGYNWSRDAATGYFYGPEPLQGELLVKESKKATDKAKLVGEGGATEAAERAYQHGLLLGAKILDQVGSSNLKAVHFIAHSADRGRHMARSAI